MMDAWLRGSSSVWRPPPEATLNLYQRPDVLAGLSAAGSTPSRAGAPAFQPATRASLLELDAVATWKAPDEFEIDESDLKRRRSPSPPPGPRISQAAASRSLRVKRRARRLADVDPTSGLSACEQLSVGPDCARRYQNANQKFEQYVIEHKLHVQTLKQLDVAMIHYFDYLLREGDNVSLPRDTLFGRCWLLGLGKDRLTFPRARRALLGFTKMSPNNGRDPPPEEAHALVCNYLLGSPHLLDVLSGLAGILEFDLYTRPTETLSIKKKHVVMPGGDRYPRWGVVIAPSTPNAAAKPTKGGAFDDTIFAGVPGSGREWVADLLKILWHQSKSDDTLLTPLILKEYCSRVQHAAAALDLEHLGMTPHSFRHGGPSIDAYNDTLSHPEIAARGRWRDLRSVRRYGQKGRLQRVVNSIKPSVLRAGQRLLRPGPASLQVNALAIAATLRKLRRA